MLSIQSDLHFLSAIPSGLALTTKSIYVVQGNGRNDSSKCTTGSRGVFYSRIAGLQRSEMMKEEERCICARLLIYAVDIISICLLHLPMDQIRGDESVR